MPTNYVTQMSNSGSGTFNVMDKEARTAITEEATARAAADTAEATARQTAITAEATARQTAITDEATARAAADTEEATAREAEFTDLKIALNNYDKTGKYEKTFTYDNAFVGSVVAKDIFVHNGDLVEIYIENITEGMITNDTTCIVYLGGVQKGSIFILNRGQLFRADSDVTSVSVYVPTGAVAKAGSFKFHVNCVNRINADHYTDIIGTTPAKDMPTPEGTYGLGSITYQKNRGSVHCVVASTEGEYTVAFPISATAFRLAFKANSEEIPSLRVYTAYANNYWGSNANIIAEMTLEKGITWLDITSEQASGMRYVLLRFLRAGVYDFDFYVSRQANNSFDTPVEVFAINSAHSEKAAEADRLKDTSYQDIVFWGDSITQGAGAGSGDQNFVQKCCELLGTDRYTNAGCGGETSWTIAARQGGTVVYIPAGAVYGSHYELKDENGNPVRPLVGGYLVGNGPPYTRIIELNGMSGELGRVGNDDYTISGINTTLQCDTPLVFPGSRLGFKVAVIFAGTNDWSDENPLESIPYIRAMVEKLPDKNYVVMGIYKANSPEYEQAMRDNFGSHFFNTRKMLVENGLGINGLTPTAEDTEAIDAGLVPPQLLADGIHPNTYGHNAIGIMLYQHMVFLGLDRIING